MASLHYVLTFTLILLTTAFLRLIYILPAIYRSRPPPRKRGTPIHLLIVLGSGGHTAEMLSLITSLNPAHYTYRSYVIGSGDDFSAGKAQEFERSLSAREETKQEIVSFTEIEGKEATGISRRNYSIHTVPRARQIHQSLLTSPLSSTMCLYACLKLLYLHPNGCPDLILTNGPATSLILILASTLLRYFSFLPLVGPTRQSMQGRSSSGNMRCSGKACEIEVGENTREFLSANAPVTPAS
ncbi:MAG: UDP-N-acetylglucosamine transferase subunit [Alectoria sarmentosa]|nr:MAG: UDP-N-acetylglucosamine transferase subunit [Alectoria sarmentosa]